MKKGAWKGKRGHNKQEEGREGEGRKDDKKSQVQEDDFWKRFFGLCP